MGKIMVLSRQTAKIYGITGFIILMLTALTTDFDPDSVNEPFEWLKLEKAQSAATNDGKTIMVFVEAEWCGICRRMENEIFPQVAIQTLIREKYHPVTIDLDSREKVIYNGQEMTEREFARKMNVSATPTIIFINPQGEVLAHQIGFNPADRFESLLNFINSDQFGEMPFEEYFKR